MEPRLRRRRPADPPSPVDGALANLAAWIDDGGELIVGRHDKLACVAMALMGDNITAGIRRCRGETLGQLLGRLDATLERALNSHDGYIDEINQG